MNVIITGGAGFVGSAVARQAVYAGHDVTIIDDLSSGRVANVPEEALMVIGHAAVENYSGADAVVHAAAVADISRSWEDGERELTWRGSAALTMSVLEQTPKNARFLLLSTAALEDDIASPYAAGKLAAEALVKAYTKAGRVNGDTSRLVSCVGRRYHHGHIADFVRMAKDGIVHALDDGTQRKSFVHVEDAARAIVHAIDGTCAPTISSETRWSWRDTVRVMRLMRPERRFDVRYRKRQSGWLGDPVNLIVPATPGCTKSVAIGVAEALEDLGW